MRDLLLLLAYKLRTFIHRIRFSYESAKVKYAREIIEPDIEKAISGYSSVRQCQPMTALELANQKTELTLSVIVPAFNAESTILNCVSSIINQNISDPFEIIIINDGSTDNTRAVLERLQNTRNIIVINQSNKGAGNARNRGLAIAKGEYILFVDSDDLVPIGAISRMLQDAKETKADIVLGNITKVIKSCKMQMYNYKGNPLLNNKMDAYNLSQGTPWGKLYRRTLWKNISFPEKYAYEDTIIFLNVFKNAGSFFFEKEPVYCFFSNRNSLYKREQNSARCLDILWVVIECIVKANTLASNPSIVDYQIVLWHLSRILYMRVSMYKNEIMLLYSFVIASVIIKQKVQKYGFTTSFCGINQNYYAMIEKAFVEDDFGTWKQCSKVLSFSGVI